MAHRREGYRHRRETWAPSVQQRRILDALSDGLTNDEIAELIGISPDGVKWHVSPLLTETGLDNRYALGEWWLKERNQRATILLPLVGKVPAGLALAGVAAGVVIVASVLLAGWVLQGNSSGDGDVTSLGLDLGEAGAPSNRPADPSSTSDGPKPFFAMTPVEQVDFRTVQISGGSLESPVTIPFVEFSNACETFSDQSPRLACSVGEDATNLPEPDPSLIRYEFRYVDVERGANVAEESYSYVPSDPPVIGPLPGQGWVELNPSVAKLIQRYLVMAEDGLVSGELSFAEGLTAALERYEVKVTLLEGRTNDSAALGEALALSPDNTRSLIELLANAEPGIVAMRGNSLGSRTLDYVQINVTIGTEVQKFFYVLPGNVAEQGVLLSQRWLTNWDGYLPELSPPGYTKGARSEGVYAVPREFDALMAQLGFPGETLDPDIEGWVEPRQQERCCVIDRVEIWTEAGEVLLPPLERQPCPEGCNIEYAVGPGVGEPLRVAIWPKGIRPFPEAVKPEVYEYYPDDGTSRSRGVLTMNSGQCAAVGGGTCRLSIEYSFYPPPPLDEVLREAAQRLR